MAVPLVLTKLHIPRRPQESQPLVPRARLWDKLNAGQRHKLTLVSAPAGFGKTTLLAEWLGQCSGQTAWLTLDQGDNDPVRFFSYLVAALRPALSTIDEQIAAYTHAPHILPPESLLALLINEIERQGQPLSLVLDDYQTIESPAIHDALRYLLAYLPPELHLILSTRSDPPIMLARMRAQGEILELRAADLCFNVQEAQTFFNEVMQLTLTPDQVATLTARTEGWAVGLQLTGLYLTGHPEPARFIETFTGSHAYIIDYLVEEVLARQPTAVKQFLIKTAILDRFCAPLVDAVLGRHDSQAVLAQLEQANLFLVPLDGERKWYRYHHLFAGMLRRILEQTEPESVYTLHEWAAVWFERNGLRQEAIHHALAATDMEYVAALLESYVDTMIGQGEFTTLAGWLDRLPEPVLHEYPRLALAQAECFLFFHDLARSEVLLAAVEEAIGSGQAHTSLLGKAAIMRADIALNRGDLAATIALTEQALATIGQDEWQLGARAYLLQGAAYVWQHCLAEGCRAYTEATRRGIQAGDVLTTLYAIGNQARAQYQQGLPRQAMATIEQSLDFAAGHQIPQSLILAGCLIVCGELLYEWDQLAEAIVQIDEGIRRAQVARNPRTLLSGLRIRLRWAAAQNRRDEVAATQAKVEALARDYALPPTMLTEFGLDRGLVWLNQNELDRVEAWLAQEGIGDGTNGAGGQERHYGLLAHLRYLQGDYDKALAAVDPALQSLAAQGPTLAWLTLAALKSIILDTMGNAPLALQTLQPALHLAEPEGVLRTFLDLGQPLRRLLLAHQTQLTAGSHAISPAYLERLLGSSRQPAATAPPQTAVEPLIETLTEREREVLRLVQEGLSDSQIAARLIIAVGTVKRHLNNLYGKLGVGSRTQALARARQLNLL